MFITHPIGNGWYIVLRDDIPIHDSHGRAFVFYRKVDAERFVEDRIASESRYRTMLAHSVKQSIISETEFRRERVLEDNGDR